jgi:hypothetical protein
MLEKEFKYYIDHQKDLVAKHEGKFVVIKGDQVLDVYDSEMEAYNASIKTNELGTFLIQQCLPGKDNYTQAFNARVIFA